MADIVHEEGGAAGRRPKRQGFPQKPDPPELPDPLAYDSAFRTMMNKCPRLILPVLNELFSEHYSGWEEVILLHSSSAIRQPGQRDLKRYPDSMFSADEPDGQPGFPPIFTVGDVPEIHKGTGLPDALSWAQPDRQEPGSPGGGGKRHYHIECESSPGRTSEAVRIFEYGFISAMDGKELRGNRLKASFPHSAVLYLRTNHSTPGCLEIEIETPGGAFPMQCQP